MADDFVDVLIVGAGLSGIGAAAHLQRHCPERSVAILEARDALGGTWDLFRYPGVRSDSDMHTLGYSFRPWTGTKTIADGASILDYLRATAREHGIDRLIRYRHRVRSASWSSHDAKWSVEAELESGERRVFRCTFLFVCSGYYDYAEGYAPQFPGLERYRGRVVHPQHWTDDIDPAGKRVVVIGSGATAVTLVPALARSAAHVTMLQRSPSYVLSLPSVDPFAQWLRRHLGFATSHALTRWKNVLVSVGIFKLCRRRPAFAKSALLKQVRRQLGPEYDIDRHFTPRYNPWEQRLCFVPDGDLFKAIRSGRASVVTDTIESFTEGGLKLAGGAELPADLVVTATGLKLKLVGGLEMRVDGHKLVPAELVNYKGVLFAGVPNFASISGYTNASWTLKADLASTFVCRLLNHMRRTGARQCVPRADGETMALQPWVDFSSGYFQRAMDQLPKQGTRKPWKLNQNYLADLMTLRFGAVDDGVMRFS
ncbi:Predicted flavoprotein CzcO associated with the cation diffusion facilitator CzcD [Variovorax sp. HW608]|uniref:flavin-containing monooxygenase n=1 Tax=Variovorax sp. HW608 TaxID=1034889 RepID=UPI00081FDE03|nr:Predicted flavoprotein CzcO associated with the cation diffusion facilitator CzcD [Variovorax sp. HW608]